MLALLRAVSLFWSSDRCGGRPSPYGYQRCTAGCATAGAPVVRTATSRRASVIDDFQSRRGRGRGPFPSDDPSRSWRAAVRGSFPPETFCLTLPAALVEEVGVGPAMPIVSKQQLISRGIADATTGVGRRGIRNSRSSRMGVAVLAPQHGALRNLGLYVHNQRRQVTTAV